MTIAYFLICLVKIQTECPASSYNLTAWMMSDLNTISSSPWPLPVGHYAPNNCVHHGLWTRPSNLRFTNNVRVPLKTLCLHIVSYHQGHDGNTDSNCTSILYNRHQSTFDGLWKAPNSPIRKTFCDEAAPWPPCSWDSINISRWVSGINVHSTGEGQFNWTRRDNGLSAEEAGVVGSQTSSYLAKSYVPWQR